MIYRPGKNRFLWDTWLFPWKDEYHLFFLESLQRNGEWVNIGHTVSNDLVHWQDMPSIKVPKGPPGCWDENPTLTGMVVHHDGIFWMFYGARSSGVQRIGLMRSNNLLDWVAFEDNPVLQADGRFYRSSPDRYGNHVSWRDPCVNWRKDWQAYEALICADTVNWDETNCGACIARCRSKDLIHWEHLPPAAQIGDSIIEAEVPDYFELEGRHYILFSSQSGFGRRLDTPTRKRTTGVYYLICESRDGEYSLTEEFLLIGAGNDRKDAYVGRTIEYGNRRLLYHHMYGDRPTWSSPKLIGASSEGDLFLEYWSGIEALETNVIREGFEGDLLVSHEPGTGRWIKENCSLIGYSPMRNTSVYLSGEINDFHLTCNVTLSQTSRLGIILRKDSAQVDETKRGIVLSLNAVDGVVEWGRLAYSDIIYLEDEVKLSLPVDTVIHIRIIVRNEHVELYLNDRWVFSAHVEDLPKKGLLGFTLDGGNVKIDKLLMKGLKGLS